MAKKHRRASKRSKLEQHEAAPPPARPQQAHCSIVGIGASAGGLEAFSDILGHMPPDPGMALVLIQHLDPRHHSVLTELLSRATPMPVLEIREGTVAESNHVYVIPPNSNLTILRGVLRLTPRNLSGPQMPIDLFFRTLADEEGSKAIGVILSGTASDGTLGLKAIKAEGGITFAQDENSAKYDGMPRSAIAAGCVDFVLPPAEIANELVRLCRHPYVAQARAEAEGVKPEHDFAEIFAMLRAATGVDFTFYKHATLARRILRRMALSRVDTTEKYVAHLRQNRGELHSLFQDILINVTGFFREPGLFDFLKAKVFPEFLRDRLPEDPIRIWVPGCSTGEEVYSLGMCLLEHLRESSIDYPIQIFGTDLSENVLDKARGGVYPESIASEVSPERLRRFFTKVNGSYQITRSVRDLCVFARQNLTKDPPFSKLDLITCRNVLIYLGPVLQQKLMRVFHYALKPKGYLALGISETVGTATDLFHSIDRKQKVYSRKTAISAVNLDLGSYEELHLPVPQKQPHEWTGVAEILRRVDQMLLSRFSPPGVVVDGDLKIVQFRGRTSPFLEHSSGEANLNLLKMSKGGLGMEIRKVIQRARARDRTVQSDAIQVGNGKALRQVRISVTPLKTNSSGDPHFLVLFGEPRPAPAQGKAPQKTEKAPASSARRLRELEQELGSTKQYLQSVIEEQEATTEELKSANEEIQSSNEELQSTNEELLTAKEELQSANEELTTVNEEMQGRNTELIQINNDLNNLLSSANIPIVMLGNDLRIRRFTPQAEKVLNLVPTDIGRPFSDFRPKILVPDLDHLFTEVIDNFTIREREVQDQDGRYYSMWIRPYRTADNKIDGVVMALFDVTERKSMAEARYRRLFEAARDGILMVDAQTGEVLDANPFIATMLGQGRTEMIGKRLWDLSVFANTDLQGMSTLQVDGDAWHRSITLTNRGGDTVDVDVMANVYQEGEQRVLQLNVRDLSGRRQEDRQMAEMRSDRRNLQSVARVAASLARSFNDSVTRTLGFVERLEQQLGTGHPTFSSELERIRQAGERTAALTRQLLAFGRHQKGVAETLDLNGVVSDLEQVIRTMLPANVSLRLETASERVLIRNDKFLAEQIVLELVAGACEVMPKGGSLTLSTSNVSVDAAFTKEHPAVPPGEYGVVHVTSRGQQISSERLFSHVQPFSTPRDTPLGFDGLQAAIRDSGAHLWSYSELGKGRSASVYFPHPPAEKPGKRAAAQIADGKETILVVDPDEAIRTLAANSLRERGYNVMTAADAASAVPVASSGTAGVDLLIFEASAPNGDARGITAKLRDTFPKLRVLYISGDTERSIAESGLDGSTPVLRKPFTRSELVRAVREALDRKG